MDNCFTISVESEDVTYSLVELKNTTPRSKYFMLETFRGLDVFKASNI